MLLQSRITLIVSVTLVALGTGSIFSGQISRKAVEDRFETALTAGKSNLLGQIVRTHVNLMQAATTSLTRNRGALAAIGEGAPDKVAEEVRPTLNRLSAGNVLNRIVITGGQGQVLYAEPAAAGGGSGADPLLNEARENGEVRSGVIAADDGAVAVAFAFPLYQRGSLIGAALFSRDYSEVVDEFVKADGGQAMLADAAGRTLHATDADVFGRLDLDIAGLTRQVTTVAGDGRASTISVIPIMAADGRRAGRLVSVNDYTESFSRQRQYDLGSVAVFLILVALVLIGLNIYLRRAFAPLGSAIGCLEAISRGETATVVPVAENDDEVGRLIGSLERVRSNIEDFRALNEHKVVEQERKVAEQAIRSEQERAVVDDVIALVGAVSSGDLTRRLETVEGDNVFSRLADQINLLIDKLDAIMREVGLSIGAMAEGDLTRRMQGDYEGAFGRLKTDIDRMAGQMEDVLQRISDVSGAVKAATDETLAGVSDLSARTESQASTLEETSAAMEEMSATVRQNAENAREADEVSTAAREAAANGGMIAGRAVSAMADIEDSSKKITEIIGLIEEIAFQTNLLALNASVEAARAGESGRGFAVVANEVRALAQRSSSASRDVKDLIIGSDRRVREGAKLVGEAGRALEEIAGSVTRVAGFVSHIAAASNEQTAGIDQVSAAVAGMDDSTQRNAALVEETNACIRSAAGQVADLQKAVAFFRTSTAASDDEAAAQHPERRSA